MAGSVAVVLLQRFHLPINGDSVEAGSAIEVDCSFFVEAANGSMKAEVMLSCKVQRVGDEPGIELLSLQRDDAVIKISNGDFGL